MIADATRRAMASGVVRPDQVVAVSCTGQWASTVPVDEDGRPVGDCVMWMDSRGGPHTRRAVGGPVSGYAPLALVALGPTQRRRAVDVGGRSHRPHAVPRARRAGRGGTGPVVPGAGRLPVDAVHRACAAASPASMTAAWLTDNRKPDRLVYDPDLVRRAGVPAEQAPTPGGHRLGGGRGAWPRSPTSSASPAASGGDRHPRPPLRRGRLGSGPRLPDPPRDQHHVVDQLPGADEEDRRRPPDRVGPRARPGSAI